MNNALNSLINEIDRLEPHRHFGRVSSVLGMLIEVIGIEKLISIGDHCTIETRTGRKVICEVVGFRDKLVRMLPFATLEGIGIGCKVEIGARRPIIYPDLSWLGRVVNSFGEPVDGKGPLIGGKSPYALHNSPPPANSRKRLGEKVDIGIRAINTFLTICKGQRLGIFSGSGVGKSTLLSMMAQYTNTDVSIIGLVGERGREAKEFIEDDLGVEGLRKSVVVLATSDEPPLVRRQAAYLTMTLCEYFRNQNKDVLCLMDSVTRFAMAQREISLSAGEPPATRGYTPTVFAELPRLLERAGPGTAGQGSVTGLFSVLVEGDDHNEPIADAVRGILDGHVVLDRSIADRGRFPAVNLLKSISRTMPDCNSNQQNMLIDRAKKLVSTYDDMAELIRLGAYRMGSDPLVDEAIHYYPSIEEFLQQSKTDSTELEACYAQLAEKLDFQYGTDEISEQNE